MGRSSGSSPSLISNSLSLLGPYPYADIRARVGLIPNDDKTVNDIVLTGGSRFISSASGQFDPIDVGKSLGLVYEPNELGNGYVTGSITTGTPNFVADSPVFSANDIGKQFQYMGASATGDLLTGSIIAVADATHCTLSTNALSTVVSGGFYFWVVGGITSGTPNLVFSAPVATPDMVGNSIDVRGAGASGGMLTTTVLAYIDSTHITLAENASTTTTVTTAAAIVDWMALKIQTTITQYISPTQVQIAATPPNSSTGWTANWGTDNNTPIQATIDYVHAAGGGTVAITGGPSARYLVGSPLTIYDNITVRSTDGAQLKMIKGFQGALFTSAVAVTNVKLKAVPIDANVTALNDNGKRLFVVPKASSHITMDRCIVTNAMSGNDAIAVGTIADTGTVQSHHITIKRNQCYRSMPFGTVSGTFQDENVRFVMIADSSDVLIEDNYGYRTAAWEVMLMNGAANTLANPARHIVQRGNVFERCPDTVLWVTGSSTSYGDQVSVYENKFTHCGWQGGKGAIACGYRASGTSTFTNVDIHHNQSRGWGHERSGAAFNSGMIPGAQINSGQGILTGGFGQMRGVKIHHNMLDASTVDGLIPLGRNHGIMLNPGIDGWDVSDNHIYYASAMGIRVIGTAGGTGPYNKNGKILRNTVLYCCTKANTGASAYDCGISLLVGCRDVEIAFNRSGNHGNSTTNIASWFAGIGISADTANADNTRIDIHDNNCSDDRPVPYQMFGTRIGIPGLTVTQQSWMPTDVTVRGNRGFGVTKASLFRVNLATDLGYRIRGNPDINPAVDPGLVDLPNMRVSAVAYSNPFNTTVTVTVSGGTGLGNVLINLVSQGVTSGTFTLGPTDTIRQSYTTSPLYIWSIPLPASTTPVTNVFGFDYDAYISGGTVTAVSINGTATGLTSGRFFWPAGSTLTLTYSAAPTLTLRQL
jgi:hypothetical protein